METGEIVDSDALLGDRIDAQSKDALRVWLYMLKCSKRLEQEMSDRFRINFNSSFSRFDVLAHLDLAGEEGLSTSQLAARLLASKGNITRLLDRMELDGLIERQQPLNDRRVSRICLAPRGAELFNRMAPAHEGWCQDILGGLSNSDRDTLIRLLRRIKGRLDHLK